MNIRPRHIKKVTEIKHMWSVYILRCADASLYTGITKDIENRLRQHNGEISGGAKYTRGRRPVELVYQQSVESFQQAQQEERRIKKLDRRAKLLLISS